MTKESELIRQSERTLWLYWNNGCDAMPPLIRRIYEHNVKTCERFGWHIVLLTRNNVCEYFPLGHDALERFYRMTPYEQADYTRCLALRDYGGLWLDSDFIVYDNPDKLMALMDMKVQDGRFERPSTGRPATEVGEYLSLDMQMAVGEPLSPATFLTVREHMRGCKGTAILASKKNSAIAQANVSYIERKMKEKNDFTEWGEIGPEIMRHIPADVISELRVINDEVAVASANFATWIKNPGWNLDIWFKGTQKEAIETAEAIDAYQLPVVGTWTLYRNHRPELTESDLVRMVFEDDRSVFKALIEKTSHDVR